MILAHTLGSGGPDIEFLLSAAALLAFGIIGYVQKVMKPAVSVILVLGSIALAAGAFAVTPDKKATPAGISVRIMDPTDGSMVAAGEPLVIEIDLQGATLTDAVDSTDASEGHIHIFVDGDVVAMPSSLTPSIELTSGPHTLEVEFVAADHQQLVPRVVDAIELTAQ